MSVAEMSTGRNVRGRNVLAEASVAEMSVTKMSEHPGMVHSIRHLNYSDRMRELGLPSLQYRRTRADLIEVFKILNGIDNCDKSQLFHTQPLQRTRGHSQKLFKRQFRLDLRKHFYSQRVIDDWNNLSENVISSDSINQF